MPTRKVGEIDRLITCNDPDHDPPSMMVYPPGRYQHVCKFCGRTVFFTVYPTFISNSVQGCQDAWQAVKWKKDNWFEVLGLGSKE